MTFSTKIAARSLTIGALSAIATALPAFAQTPGAMAGDKMTGDHMMGAATTATYVCRAATGAEKPSAMMGSSALVCKPVAVAMKMSDGKMHMMGNAMVKNPSHAPDTSGLTVPQVNDAYAKWLTDLFSVNGSNGN